MKPSLQTRSESVGLGGDGGRGEITHYNDKYLLLRNYGTDKSKDIKDHTCKRNITVKALDTTNLPWYI